MDAVIVKEPPSLLSVITIAVCSAFNVANKSAPAFVAANSISPRMSATVIEEDTSTSIVVPSLSVITKSVPSTVVKPSPPLKKYREVSLVNPEKAEASIVFCPAPPLSEANSKPSRVSVTLFSATIPGFVIRLALLKVKFASACSLSESMPVPPYKRSSPSPPVMISFPSSPLIMSMPVPPIIISSPVPPLISVVPLNPEASI